MPVVLPRFLNNRGGGKKAKEAAIALKRSQALLTAGKLLGDMQVAAGWDSQVVGEPATAKLVLLPRVEAAVLEVPVCEALLANSDFLSTCATWLHPNPITHALAPHDLRLLASLPIDTSLESGKAMLKTSGIGKVVQMHAARDPDLVCKQVAASLVQKWICPVLGKTQDLAAVTAARTTAPAPAPPASAPVPPAPASACDTTRYFYEMTKDEQLAYLDAVRVKKPEAAVLDYEVRPAQPEVVGKKRKASAGLSVHQRLARQLKAYKPKASRLHPDAVEDSLRRAEESVARMRHQLARVVAKS